MRKLCSQGWCDLANSGGKWPKLPLAINMNKTWFFIFCLGAATWG
jgi:hypothetical protein